MLCVGVLTIGRRLSPRVACLGGERWHVTEFEGSALAFCNADMRMSPRVA